MPPAASAKRLGKRFIGYPEEIVPVVSVQDWAAQYTSSPKQRFMDYVVSLFPIFQWLPRYNLGWLTGDVIAGLTVGMVLVPQGMSYAQIATLPPEFGLYSSFVGVSLYCFFATSKDVSIGPVAVMSLTTAQIIKHVQNAHPNEWTGPTIASTLALITGFIVLGIGLLRIGWLVEFIPAPAVSGFMTGSAISIAAGQVPGLMGITGFDTRAATYKVIINTLKGLPETKLDAAWGLPGLITLYGIRLLCDYLGKRFPRRARLFFFISVLRNAFVILILTIAAWLYTRHRKSASGKYPIKILQTVPPGFKHIGQPNVDHHLIAALAPELPVATIILLLEHIAISKSFGRLNGYKINPNQELIAIGVTNTIGSCFGAYPATGSFSRSALKSKSGVRTPAAGIITAVVVIVALYGLTPAFYWIPNAGLSAVIIHAVADLVASPSQVYSYWRVSPLEFVIWVAAVIVTIFSSIENGIYTSIASSMALLLLRIAHPRGSFLGKVTIKKETSDSKESREVFVPLKRNSVNPHVKIVPPSPGVIVYRFEESYLYPNASLVNDALVDYVKENMRRGKDLSNVRPSDRPWNDPGPGRNAEQEEHIANQKKPILHAIVLDFSMVSHIDTTAVQALIDTRTEVEKWADHPVEFHFATILSPWIRRALTAAGFGLGISASRVPPDLAAVVPYRDGRHDIAEQTVDLTSDVESGDIKKTNSRLSEQTSELEPIVAEDTPFFHIDLLSAVRAAESGLGRIGTSN
ncbi:putative STAS domain containing protein [Lyophyllum shimeji]|uniref:STAS domain containing protein n=1 Tax=Lyophyllum shimeji TaxID=47721 RepID=A0A9P3ULE7_LYOSH|nr:putative STAS domain containing protein [Lyophyllum shimeji]